MMLTLTKERIKNGEGFASYELRDKLLKIESDTFVNFSYTDYGGDFFDRVCCEYFEEKYKDNFISENTSYFGKNGYLFGEVAKQFIEEAEDYLLGFEDLEDYYTFKEYEAEEKSFQEFLEGLRTFEDYEVPEEALNWLLENKSGHYQILSSGEVDFSYKDLEDELINNNLITKLKEV